MEAFVQNVCSIEPQFNLKLLKAILHPARAQNVETLKASTEI